MASVSPILRAAIGATQGERTLLAEWLATAGFDPRSSRRRICPETLLQDARSLVVAAGRTHDTTGIGSWQSAHSRLEMKSRVSKAARCRPAADPT
jgi:hypothetical protein